MQSYTAMTSFTLIMFVLPVLLVGLAVYLSEREKGTFDG